MYDKDRAAAHLGTEGEMVEKLISYADALAAALRRSGDFKIDGLRFVRPTRNFEAYLHVGGRHTMIYELSGTGKRYRVTVEPVPETHR